MHEQGDAPNEPGMVSNRVLEIVVALALLCLSAIVITDSVRLGIGWAEGEGPRAGYFPFYIAVVLTVASVAILLKAVMGKGDGLGDAFVSRPASLLPTSLGCSSSGRLAFRVICNRTRRPPSQAVECSLAAGAAKCIHSVRPPGASIGSLRPQVRFARR